jgi:hypothetical protein
MKRPPHRGSNGDMTLFAQAFIRKRTWSLSKDIEICLTGTSSGVGGSTTHAYFPALATCCAFLEYMTGLHRGKLGGIGWDSVEKWTAAYLNAQHYNKDIVRVLFDGFRHSVAHRGIATGIWVDRHRSVAPARKITWKLTELSERPSCQLLVDNGVLLKDPPWPSPHTHRMHIHLRSLAEDLAAGAEAYAVAVETNPELQANFTKAMQALYPREMSS